MDRFPWVSWPSCWQISPTSCVRWCQDLRSVEDCWRFVAFQRLYLKFNSETVASAIRLLAEVCSLVQVKELMDIDPAVCAWRQKVALLCKGFNDDFQQHESRDRYVNHPGLFLHVCGWPDPLRSTHLDNLYRRRAKLTPMDSGYAATVTSESGTGRRSGNLRQHPVLQL